MLVQVFLLRKAGERLPTGAVRAQSGLAGRIRLYKDPGWRLGNRDRVAVLCMPDGRRLELHEAQLMQWDLRGLILSGEERLYGGRRVLRHPQAWWCQPLLAGASAGPDAGRPLSLPGLPGDSIEAWAEDAPELPWAAS